MVRKEEQEGERGNGAAGEIHRRNFSDLLSSHLLHWRERREKEGKRDEPSIEGREREEESGSAVRGRSSVIRHENFL